MTNLSTQESFEKKITDKLRQDIGDLLPDELLSQIVEKSIQEIFFKPKQKLDSWGRTQSAEYSWLEETVKDLLQEQVKEQVKLYLTNNKEEVDRIIKESLEGGISKALMNAVNTLFQGEMLNLQNSLINRLTQR